ncbi:ParB family protein [Xenorhabdus bovienii]|uniref:ParB family protein n=1 Tax=Xenorhabdus bovienii TaxID=40576 RepID=UPI00237C77E7|nr:ParB family protein [Xenorhabdus bovienii]MDE1491943.1 ParB family protein [Xenorhabdus bovienii]
MARQHLNMGNALLQQGRQAAATLSEQPPVSEMPMVLTLDQLRPNPDNPRTGRNPRYEDIKISIKVRGLDTVPKVTRDPQGDEHYIFSDGGNTRYQILSELWQETGDERFYRVHCLFKPWPGRLQCVIGHLAENELRGELSFIEKALGIHKARSLYEEQQQKKISLREFSALLNQTGYPVSASQINRMEDTVQYLYPWIPNLLGSGLGIPQIQPLLVLRRSAETVWQQHRISLEPEPIHTFDEVFGACCHKFDAPEAWSLEMFRDELIGDLLQALPHPQLNYDRWILELDPKESNRKQLFGQAVTAFEYVPVEDDEKQPDAKPSVSRENSGQPGPATSMPSVEKRDAADNDVVTVAESDNPSQLKPVTKIVPVIPRIPPDAVMSGPELEPLDFAQAGIEPVNNIWGISPMQDDIDHLQNMAFRLAFELAETMNCENEVMSASDELSVGYRLTEPQSVQPFALLLLSLSGERPSAADPLTLTDLLLGTAIPEGTPLLDDRQTVKFLRLIRIIRRLRELQRKISPDNFVG